jgi:hypothetical protein
LSPQYGLPGKGGLETTQYWPDKPSNITEISYKMFEYVSLVNAVFKYETPYLTEVVKQFPGAHIAVMDINGLVSEILPPVCFVRLLTISLFSSSPISTTTHHNTSTAPRPSMSPATLTT